MVISPMLDLELIYVADPMCSWCWGFAPSIEAIADHHSDLPVRVVMGGLRPGAAAEPLSDGMRSYLRQAWTAVGDRSGQPFDHSFLDRDGWTYDTERAAIAVVAMRQVDETQT
ncbi:MAG: DsbA family protein, partial [Acidimicrobiia bacterium]|nr:DsbA family protein [Acidimicrobiia bacterium]